MISDDPIQTEAAIRAAAKAAAKDVPLGESYLSKIVAETNRPGLSVADRIARATTMAEQFAASPKALNFITASPHEIQAAQASAQFAAGRSGISMSAARGDTTDRSSTAERRTSGEYDRMASAGIDRGTYNALLSEGFSKQQLGDAARVAQHLGWTDRDSVRNLANAGKPFASLAEKYEDARQKGDTARMGSIMDQMREQRDHATGKQKDGMNGIIDKFEKLNEARPGDHIQTKSEQKFVPQPLDKEQKAVFDALKRKQAALTPSK